MYLIQINGDICSIITVSLKTLRLLIDVNLGLFMEVMTLNVILEATLFTVPCNT